MTTTLSPYLEDRAPARILEGGTFALPGMPGASHTYGHDAVVDAAIWLASTPMLAVDIETEGLGKAAYYLKCVTVATADHAVVFDPRDPAQFHALRTVLNSPDVMELVFHNSAFDVTPLAVNGLLDLDSILHKVRDTLIYARMATPDERAGRSLSDCARTYLGYAVEDRVTARAKTLGWNRATYFKEADLNMPAYRWDAASDGIATIRLFPVIRQAAYDRLTTGHPFTKFGVTGEEAWRLVERPQRVNRRMLWRSAIGFRWDPEYLDRYRARNELTRASAEIALERHGIRPGVSQDLIKYMDGEGLLPEGYPKTATGQHSGAKDHLKLLGDHPLVAMFTAHKEDLGTDAKYLSKVADLADHHGRVHPAFNILGASSTGRMSITGIPFHQFDAEARGIILEDNPGDGMVSVDWTQQEPVIAANLGGDRRVLERYENARTKEEGDLYLGVAEFAHIQRKEAKIVILAQMYGQGLVRLALGLGLITPAEAKAVQDLCRQINPATVGLRDQFGNELPPRRYWPLEAAEELGITGVAAANLIKGKVWEAMPGTEALVRKVKKIARDYKVIFTLSGRILPIPSAWYADEYGAMTHKGPNYTIQGGAADQLEETICDVEDAGLGDALMIPMHDELVVKREAAHDIATIMQKGPARLNFIAGRETRFRTDIADMGERWAKV